MKRIAIFASGSGTNAENIIEFFKHSNEVVVSLILSNKTNAFVLERAKKFDIPTFTFNREQFYNSPVVDQVLAVNKIDFIVLAGFLWLIPKRLTDLYQNKIVNIHPALLPKYGGAGMYGDKVHQAVKLAGETESGITIHYVNENYDEGNIIFQARCQLTPGDTPDSIAQKVHALEYQHFPKIIESVLKKI